MSRCYGWHPTTPEESKAFPGVLVIDGAWIYHFQMGLAGNVILFKGIIMVARNPADVLNEMQQAAAPAPAPGATPAPAPAPGATPVPAPAPAPAPAPGAAAAPPASYGGAEGTWNDGVLRGKSGTIFFTQFDVYGNPLPADAGEGTTAPAPASAPGVAVSSVDAEKLSELKSQLEGQVATCADYVTQAAAARDEALKSAERAEAAAAKVDVLSKVINWVKDWTIGLSIAFLLVLAWLIILTIKFVYHNHNQKCDEGNSA